MSETVLANEVVGLASGSRIVLVHGFSQTRRCWGPVAEELAVGHELVLIDAPGHGESCELAVDFASGAAMIGEVGGHAMYVGYSMGGRYCLQLAFLRPELVHRLVLIGASPGIHDSAERATRRRSDDELAARIESIGVDAFLHEWLMLPLFAGLDDTSRFVDERRRNTAAGLASSLRLAGTGAQPDLWPELSHLTVPTLLVTGERDAKFTAIAEEMANAIGRADVRHAVIPDAGHTAHVENPAAFFAVISAFL